MIKEIEDYTNTLNETKDEILDIIKELDETELNWTPLSSEKTNSIYSIVVHICGSDKFMIQGIIGGLQYQRDRDAEFIASGKNSLELETLLKETLNATKEVLDSFTAQQLDETRDFPVYGQKSVRWGILKQIYHHGLHLGHIQLTKQMYEADRGNQ